MTNIDALSARHAIEIAHEYGLRARYIRAELEQAREQNGWNGRSAAEYFRGFVQDVAHEISCESHAARAFEDAAYGRDY